MSSLDDPQEFKFVDAMLIAQEAEWRTLDLDYQSKLTALARLVVALVLTEYDEHRVQCERSGVTPRTALNTALCGIAAGSEAYLKHALRKRKQ